MDASSNIISWFVAQQCHGWSAGCGESLRGRTIDRISAAPGEADQGSKILKVASHEVEPGHGTMMIPSHEKKSTTVITMSFIAALLCDIPRFGMASCHRGCCP